MNFDYAFRKLLPGSVETQILCFKGIRKHILKSQSHKIFLQNSFFKITARIRLWFDASKGENFEKRLNYFFSLVLRNKKIKKIHELEILLFIMRFVNAGSHNFFKFDKIFLQINIMNKIVNKIKERKKNTQSQINHCLYSRHKTLNQTNS